MMKKLLEAVTKFSGEPEQKPGDQVKGTDKAKTGGKKHPFLNQLVGEAETLKQKDADNALEKELTESFANFDESTTNNEYTYKLLSRLQRDCEYFLNAGNRSERSLWAGNVSDQIAKMKELWSSLPEDGKPQWLSQDDILNYEQQMTGGDLHEDEYYPPHDDGGRSAKQEQTWTEDDMWSLQNNLVDIDGLEDYYIANLSYYPKDNKYGAIMKPYDMGGPVKRHYKEINFDIDSGGGSHYPIDVDFDRLYGQSKFLGGFNDQEEFISESLVAEDNLGVEPKRPNRKGARHARGHTPDNTNITEDESILDTSSLRSTYDSIKDWNYRSLRGLARKVGVDADEVDRLGRGDEHELIDNILFMIHGDYNETELFDDVQIDNSAIEAHGVKGVKSTPWRKTFKSQQAYERWLDANEGNVQVYGTRKVKPGITKETDTNITEDSESNTAHDIVRMHADADMMYDEIVYLLTSNGITDTVAKQVASEYRGIDEDASPEERKSNRDLYDKIRSKGVVPGIDRERYTDLSHEGLEGPFRAKNGEVLYYDPKEGKYYNRDNDMYVDYGLDEGKLPQHYVDRYNSDIDKKIDKTFHPDYSREMSDQEFQSHLIKRGKERSSSDTVSESNEGIDNLLTKLRRGWRRIEDSEAYSEHSLKAIHEVYNGLRGALMAGKVDLFKQKWAYYSANYTDAFDHLMDECDIDADIIRYELNEEDTMNEAGEYHSDPDWAYDQRRQAKADAATNAAQKTVKKFYVYDGVQRKAVSPEFDTQAEAITVRDGIELNHNHLSIQIRNKKVAETVNEYAGMDAIPQLRDRNDYQQRMKAIQDMQMDPDTAKDPQLRLAVMKKRAELTKQAREQGLIENWVVVNKSNKVIKMFESKKVAYDFVIENIFETDYKVVRRDSLKESDNSNLMSRGYFADGSQKGPNSWEYDQSKPSSLTKAKVNAIQQVASKLGITADNFYDSAVDEIRQEFSNRGMNVGGDDIIDVIHNNYTLKSGALKEYGATSTGSPTSTPGASAVPTPKQPTPVTPPSSAKPTPVTPAAPAGTAKPGANADVDTLAQAAARDPKMAAQLKAMAAQSKTGR